MTQFKRNAIAEEAGLTSTEPSSIKRRAGVLAEEAGMVHFKRNAKPLIVATNVAKAPWLAR